MRNEGETLYSRFEKVAAEKGNRVALTAEAGIEYTYTQLKERVEHLAGYLSKCRLGRGEKAALYLPNSELYPLATLAAMKLGLTVTPLNTMAERADLHYVISRSDAKVLLTSREMADRLGECREGTNVAEIILLDQAAWEDAAPLVSPPYVDPEDLAQILFTSGTSGQPRGAMLTHAALLSNVEACVEAFELSEEDGYLCAMPLFHSFASTVGMFIPLLTGGAVHIVARPEPARILKRLEESRASVALGVPALFAALVTSGLRPSKPLSQLRFFVSGGAALYSSVHAALKERFGVPVYEGYGVTECAPVVAAQTPGDKEIRPGTVGRPLKGVKVRIVDEHDRDLAAGVVGEIVVAGPNLMLGYYDNPLVSSKALRGGWFHTGDLGTLSEEGILTVVDRMSDRIYHRGLPITPREVENVLLSLPGVKEAAVVGVSDETGEERVVAYVVPSEAEEKKSARLAEELIAGCRSRLAIYKVPETIEFRQSLPKTATGKILKRTLKQKWL